MEYSHTLEYFEESAAFVRSKTTLRPQVGMILGTGLGALADAIENRTEIPYVDIPNFLVSTVKSHAGKLIIGTLQGKTVACMSGRFHYYEGYDFGQLTAPVRLFWRLGVKNVILTNAAGAINTGYRPGDLMIIKDHLNIPGASPMRGENDERIGPRFFDVCDMYSEKLRAIAREAARTTPLRVHEGIYAYQVGPHFETPAEIRFLRMAGADACGMSTVTEALTAAHCGLPCLAISLITNMAAGVVGNRVSGDEVDEAGARASAAFSAYMATVVGKLPGEEDA